MVVPAAWASARSFASCATTAAAEVLALVDKEGTALPACSTERAIRTEYIETVIKEIE